MKSQSRLSVLGGLFALALATASHAQPVTTDAVTGLWVYQTSFPVGLSGELILTRREMLDDPRYPESAAATISGASSMKCPKAMPGTIST
jgi:hypothetical protein